MQKLLIPLTTFFFLCSVPSSARDIDKLMRPIFERVGNTFQDSSGPWGTLTYKVIVLTPCSTSVADCRFLDACREGTVWRFLAGDVEEVRQQLLKCGIESELISDLVNNHLTKSRFSSLFEIRPPDQVVLSLTSEQRILLYRILFPRERSNFYFNPDILPEFIWTSPRNVPIDLQHLLRRLSYDQNGVKRFADLPLVISKASNETEKIAVVQMLNQERSLIVKVAWDPSDSEQSTNAIRDYWSAEGRNPNFQPLFEALVNSPDHHEIDLVHLLPLFPRKMIHTYPMPDEKGIQETAPDCFWTAFNFFAEEPSDRFLDPIDFLVDRYRPVPSKERMFGDLVVFADKKTGKVIHAANYLASNLVYTKNGKSHLRPWIISSLFDVARYYLDDDIVIGFYRQNK